MLRYVSNLKWGHEICIRGTLSADLCLLCKFVNPKSKSPVSQTDFCQGVMLNALKLLSKWCLPSVVLHCTETILRDFCCIQCLGQCVVTERGPCKLLGELEKLKAVVKRWILSFLIPQNSWLSLDKAQSRGFAGGCGLPGCALQDCWVLAVT